MLRQDAHSGLLAGPLPRLGLQPRIDSAHRYPDVTRAVGLTPVVRLNAIHEICGVSKCWIKLESCNPGGSIKEKNATYLVDLAEARGTLKPGGTIVESSSGNFGVALAIVGAVRNYRVIIVVDQKTTPFFRHTLRSYGAELVEVDETAKDASGSMQKARMARAKQIADSIPGSFYPCQHLNSDNVDAHATYTAAEIESVFGQSLDAIVVGVSTAGQISGISSLAKRQPGLKIVAVDVEGSASFGSPPKPYLMTGLGLSFRPPNLRSNRIAEAFEVPERLAYSICTVLAQREGLLLGASTGAIVAAGLNVATRLGPDCRVLMLNPDHGNRYLETVYNPGWRSQHNLGQLSTDQLNKAIEELDPKQL